MNAHNVIIIPGLGDNITLTSLATKHWAFFGLSPIIHPVKWHEGEAIQTKLDVIVDMVDKYIAKGDRVSLVGCSAGGSAVLNVFSERKDAVHKVAIICGRLNTGKQSGFRSLKERSKSSPAFAQSVSLAENKVLLFSASDRKKIMTARAIADELVPADTSVIHGAYNQTIPMLEHSLAIYSALTVFSGPIIKFLS
jgi:hypothetical protein